MTSYIVLLPGDESLWENMSQDEKNAVFAKHTEFSEALAARGHTITGGAELPHSREAKVVRRGADGLVITDGPYAEAVEQLSGFYLVDSDNFDDLLACCGILADEEGGIEVRRLLLGEDSEAAGLTEVERVLRNEWARLVALLVAQYRRLDLAEDGLGDAFEAAARTWPHGVPDNPTAWLLTTARNRIIDRLRTEAVAGRKLPLLAVEVHLTEEAQRVMADAGEPVVDERLRLVLLCAHPALAPESAAALTLRLVLGVSTADIARLFLVSQATMAARLTRARKRLAGESFSVPSEAELATRVAAVADIAYLAFTAGYAPGSGADVLRAEQAGEAIRLVRVLRSLLPEDYAGRLDLDALLALMLFQHSRRDARVAEGRLVLLPDQDRALWHHDEIVEAMGLLQPWLAAPSTAYLLQALIAAEHAVAPRAIDTDWRRIAGRYAELEALTGSPVVRLNRAVAVAELDGPIAGLMLLDDLDLPGHRLPGVRAELQVHAGLLDEARRSYDEAIANCDNEAERTHLLERRAAV